MMDLPLVFMLLMAVAMLLYVLLDGFDLGVGVLLLGAPEPHKDTMIASIGPFWDANETWLVLGVGILLVAFPLAHGVILSALYLPVALMLIGLILRGVAFDFRVKAHAGHKPLWDAAFFAGSLLTALAQGFMLGRHILGYESGLWPYAFAVLIALCLVAGYALLGAGWLLMKTDGALQARARHQAYVALWLTGLGIAAVSLATPLVSERIHMKWFALPQLLWLSLIPLVSAIAWLACERSLRKLGREPGAGSWQPFAYAVGLFVLAFIGLAYSLFPYLVIDRITIWDAASAPESLRFILVGVVITLPAILAYTAYSYRVFWGKAKDLSYE